MTLGLQLMTRLLTVALILSGAQAGAAQLRPLSSLHGGDTVRVWAVAPRLNGQTGIFNSTERDTLRFFTLGQLPPAIPTAVGFPALRRVDVQRGMHRSPSRIVIGSVLGAAAGALVGAFLGMAIECGTQCGDEGDFEGVAGFVLGGGTGIIAGGLTGGIIASRHRTARWDAVDLRR